MQVKDIMTKKVFTLQSDKKALAAQEIMDWAHVRHVPVVDAKGHLVGLLSRQDLLKAALARISSRVTMEVNQKLSMIPIDTIWERNVRTVSPDASIRDAVRLMRGDKLSCLPVVEGGKLVGILTDWDLLRILEEPTEVELFMGEKAARR